MAFDRPIEADRVEDLGLFSSFIRAPLVGTILWLLGGDEAKKEQDEEDRERRASMNADDVRETDASAAGNGKNEDGIDVDQGKGDCQTTDDPSTIEPWPRISSAVDSDEDFANFPNYEKFVTSDISSPHVSQQVLRTDSSSSGPASRVVDELVAVMDASSLDERGGMKKRGPKRSSSRSDLAALDTCDASESEFTSSKPLSSRGSTQNLSRSNRSISSMNKKKMSWSDETGAQPLVEYFDERMHECRYKRSNCWKPSRSCSFDSQDKMLPLSRGGRSKVRVIKSALKRSGSYSPPMMMHVAPSLSMDSEVSSQHSSTTGMKSFRSISVVGSTSSDSTSSDSWENRHVPSSLQVGSERTSGGLIIPTGGPGVFPGYQLTLGTNAKPEGSSQEEETKLNLPSPENPASTTTMPHPQNRHSKPHHFLPHHSNGYISPQYGFYVNITPPTPEMFYPRPPPGPTFDKYNNKNVGQSYQQFTNQRNRPSPIPEVTTVTSPTNENNPPSQPLFQDKSPAPRRREKLKPAFTKNKMGMFWSENPHQVWPTVPFG